MRLIKVDALPGEHVRGGGLPERPVTAAAGAAQRAASARQRRALRSQGHRGMLARLLRSYLRPYSGAIAVVAALFAIQGAGNLYLPRVNAELIDNGMAMGDARHIWALGRIMLSVTVAQCVIAVIALYWASRISAGVGKDLRAAVFARVQAFSLADLHRFGTPSLITRNTNDVQQIQLFLQMALTLMVIAPIICVGGLIMALGVDVALSALLIVAIPVMAAVAGALLNTAIPLFRAMQSGIDRINQVLREQITGVRVIRAFTRTQAESQRFGAANADLTALALRVNRILVLAMPGLTVVLNLASVAVLWFGGGLVSRGSLPIGALTAFLSYILQILMSVMMSVTMVMLAPRAVASAERIQQVITMVPSVTAPRHPVAPEVRTGAVEFRDVCFQYPGSARPVLHDLTISMRPGASTAIIGGTGSGKTTLLSLIPRLQDTSAGEVAVDGVGVRFQDPQRLRAVIGLVPQDAFLFSGTIAANLRFGKADATDADLWQALRTAQASDFVAELPGQLDATIGTGGTSLAGGQQQRLAIARTLVRRPLIYLFDDCFAALDGATDARLRAALRAATAGAAVVIAAQRVCSVADADQIVVLDDGRIAGVGDHRELLASCATYREIVSSQLGQGGMA
jgi:ATP-binding cassette subfamily B multidrug efflux pump